MVLEPKRIRETVPSEEHELCNAALFGSKPDAKGLVASRLQSYADTRVYRLAELEVTVRKSVWYSWTQIRVGVKCI